MKLWMLVVVSGVVMAAPARESDLWPRFRGPNGSGTIETGGLPSEASPSKNLVWKTNLPRGHSSPAIAGNRIFLTAGDEKKLVTYAIDARSGRIEWEREAPRSRTTKIQPKNTYASPSPVTDGSNVYVFFEDFGLLSYDADGNERWRYAMGPFNVPYGMGVSPILVGDLVVMVCDQDTDSFLEAVDKDDGRRRWKTSRPEATHGFSTPVVWRPAKGAPQVIVSGSYQIAGYDSSTGEKRWWVDGMAWQAKSTPVIDGDRLYVYSWMANPSELGTKLDPLPFREALEKHDTDGNGLLSQGEVQDETIKALWFLFDLDHDGNLNERDWSIYRARGTARNGLYAIQLGGHGNLTRKILWRYEKALPNIPSPLLYRNVLYVLKEGGILTALDPKSGNVLKQGRITGALGGYFASPVAADGKLYTASMDGKLAVLKAGADWEVISVGEFEDEIWATPAIAGSHVFVRTQSALYCFGSPS